MNFSDIKRLSTRAYDLPLRMLFLKLGLKFSKRRPLESFNEEHPCIFVLSTGRSGTQTLTGLIALAPNVLTFHEPYPDLLRLARLGYQNKNSSDSNGFLTDSFLAFREEQLNLALQYGKGYVETGPQCTFFAPSILKAFPQAKFIHIVRNPYMVVRSGMRRGWNAGHALDKYRIYPLQESPYLSKWDGMDAFKKSIWQWAETNRWILNFMDTLPIDRKLFLRAEDLFNGNEQTISEIYDFISSSPPSQRLISNVLNKKINSQTEGYFAEPQDWTDDMKNDLKEIAGEIAKSMGYIL